MIEFGGKSLGQLAFEAYRAEVRTAFNGDPIPEWDRLDNGAPARRGWEAAAAEVAHLVRASDIADGQFDAGYSPPGSRTRTRMRPSRWEPLGVSLPVEVDEAAAVRTGLLDPVDVDTAAAARGSVPVEADDETADNAP